jgi:TRAP transporter TAXI family solute receptor
MLLVPRALGGAGARLWDAKANADALASSPGAAGATTASGCGIMRRTLLSGEARMAMHTQTQWIGEQVCALLVHSSAQGEQVMKTLRCMIVAAAAAGIAAAAQAQDVRVIASNPQGSIFYSASAAIGKLIDEKLKMQVRVQPMGGSSTYIPLLNRGEVDFGLTNVDDALTSLKGTGNFRQPNPNLRLMAAVFPLTLGVIVPNDSPIKTTADLKGKTMPYGFDAQTTGRVLQQAVLATAGLTINDIKTVPTQSLFSGVDMLAEGKVEAATIAIGTAQAQRANVTLNSRGGIRFIMMDTSPEAMARVRKILPSRPITIQPAPHAVGIVTPTTILAYSIFLSTHAKMPDDVVYNVVKAIHAGKEDMIKGHPIFRTFNPAQMNEEIGVPWHPGAVKFYQEIKQWPPKS